VTVALACIAVWIWSDEGRGAVSPEIKESVERTHTITGTHSITERPLLTSHPVARAYLGGCARHKTNTNPITQLQILANITQNTATQPSILAHDGASKRRQLVANRHRKLWLLPTSDDHLDGPLCRDAVTMLAPRSRSRLAPHACTLISKRAEKGRHSYLTCIGAPRGIHA